MVSYAGSLHFDSGEGVCGQVRRHYFPFDVFSDAMATPLIANNLQVVTWFFAGLGLEQSRFILIDRGA